MKTTFNLTTSYEDLDRFSSREDLLQFMEGFDGVELMCLEEDAKGFIPKERVIGVHMGYFPYWLDFWRGNQAAMLQEFGSLENQRMYYGSDSPRIIVDNFKRDLENAHHYGAEYVVLHTTHCTIEESFTWKYRNTDEEVIDALCEVVNEAFRDEDGSICLLLENLWQPGFTFLSPEVTERMLKGIAYENKGLMLDTGHLFHTNLELMTQEEGIAYTNHLLDIHGELARSIKGIHLNQSLTSEYCKKTIENPPRMAEDYMERCGQMFFHAFAVDAHRPFTTPAVRQLVERIAPEYLTFEFITRSREEHAQYLRQQREALGML